MMFNSKQVGYIADAISVAQPFWFRVASIINRDNDDDVEKEALLRAHTVFKAQMLGEFTVPVDLRVLMARLRKDLIRQNKKPALVLTRISEAGGPPAASIRRLVDHYGYSGSFRSRWLNSYNEAITFLLATRTQFPAIIPQAAFNNYLVDIMTQTGREQVGSALCRCSLRLTREQCAVCGYQSGGG